MTKRVAEETIRIADLIENIVELLRWQRQELNWQLDLEEIEFKGSLEQWKVVMENLLDNQIRYADTIIVIRVSQRLINKQPYMFIRIFNDGPPLEEDLIDRLFEEYQQGFKGQFGLGLAIVREIVGHHSGRIWVNNEEEGVAFYLEIPII
jgi:two-component system sensor histidine kinase CssS